MSSPTGQLDLVRAAREGDREACERMIIENSGLIWSVARRFFGRGAEADDLYQLGCVGFLKALRDFDESFGTQFSTYAVPKITGEIRRFLRDDGAIKVSRSVKERAGVIRSSRDRLAQQLGREPTLSEIERETGIDAEDIAATDLATEPVESIHRESPDGGWALEQSLGSEGIEDALVENIALRESVRTLPDKERQVLELRFFRGMTQQQTAKVMGISQVQVSRIERRAVGALRSLML